MQRRKFMKLASGGIVLAATTTATSAGAMFGVPSSAISAWQAPNLDLGLREWILSYALLAPNPHNMQPWIADLSVKDEITLKFDLNRLLPATDPYGRQILMGAGAFLELLSMAAAEKGFIAQPTLFPDGEPREKLDNRAFARIRLMQNATVVRDPLFVQVLNRRTDRRAYDGQRMIGDAEVTLLRQALGNMAVRFGIAGAPTQTQGVGDAQRVADIRRIAREAWRIELTTEVTMMESMHVLRIGSREIDKHRDGISLTKPLVVLLERIGLFDRNKFPAPDSSATKGQLRDFDTITAATPAYFWLSTAGNSRGQQIEAGRAYVRVNLAGAAAGLAMHPNEQALQEFAEMRQLYSEVHQLLEAEWPKNTLQMLARVGYLPTGTALAQAAPRRGLAAHLPPDKTVLPSA